MNIKQQYVLIKDENRYAVVWKARKNYDGRYLDDPEYDLYVFTETEFIKPKLTIKLVWYIIKFKIFHLIQKL